MAIEHVSYAITHTVGTDGYLVSSGGLPSLIPEGVSMTVVLTVLNATGDPLDCTGATVKMYGRPEESGIAFVLLSTGAVSGTNNNVLTFTVDKNTIPAGWALYPGVVTFLWEAENGTGAHLVKILQRHLTIYSESDAEDIVYPYTEDIPMKVESYTTTATLSGKPGIRIIMCDPSGGVFTLTLNAAGTYDGAILLIHNEDTTNNVKIAPNGAQTINEVAGNQTIGPLEDLLIWENGSNWAAYNPRLTIP